MSNAYSPSPALRVEPLFPSALLPPALVALALALVLPWWVGVPWLFLVLLQVPVLIVAGRSLQRLNRYWRGERITCLQCSAGDWRLVLADGSERVLQPAWEPVMLPRLLFLPLLVGDEGTLALVLGERELGAERWRRLRVLLCESPG